MEEMQEINEELNKEIKRSSAPLPGPKEHVQNEYRYRPWIKWVIIGAIILTLSSICGCCGCSAVILSKSTGNVVENFVITQE